MKCPRCQHTLETVEYEGVEIETCPGCQGEWLDAGELLKIVKAVEKVFTPEEIAALDAINRNIFSIIDTGPDELHCPHCTGEALRKFNYASSTGILLDKCRRCKGIWLDKDELEKVQALVEEWEKNLEQDKKSFGSLLQKTRAHCQKELEEAVCISRYDFVNAVLRRFV